MAHHHHSQRAGAFYLDQSSIHCKAGCGFYGNAEWLGYCSKCFKQLNSYHQQRQQNPQTYNAHPQPPSPQYLQHQQQQQYQAHSSPPIPHSAILPQPVQLPYGHPYSHIQSAQPQFFAQQPPQQQSYYYPYRTPAQPEHFQQYQNILQIDQSASNQVPSLLPHTTTTVPSEGSPANFVDHQASRNSDTIIQQQQQSSPSPSNIRDSPSNETLNNSDLPSTPGNTSSTSSVLNSSTLLNNLTSPTSLVMIGYDTLTNLHNTILNTAKSSFRGSPSVSTDGGDSASIHSTSQSEYHVRPRSGRRQWPTLMQSATGRKGSLDQTHFLYDVAWVDCLNHTNKFAKYFLTMERRSDKSINDLSDMVHDFYEKMSQRFETQFIYKGAAADQLELLSDNVERILNEHIYHAISARIINEDEDHIMAIQKRIRSLNWITVEHLEIDIDFQRPTVHDLLDKAICQLVEMNSRTSTIDKLECIVQCSKTIFELLQAGPTEGSGSSMPVSADHFLPVLVFVVIQANPPMLPADMKFLTRFSNPSRLMKGETGYYFTNLCCALQFVEKASGASLNISEDEFNRYMSGQSIPATSRQFQTYLCDGLRTMCSNEASLKKLYHKNELRNAKIDNLMEQIDVHLETTRAKLQEMQTFATNLGDKLKLSLPKFYLELRAKNKEQAAKLLPSQLRQSI